ncbi:sulfotransferase [Paraglaciecola sp.]|uniref:sulfotransferase family protein n=1 Tax=Paraglaciecola sp. TaxID=1920173 RepID=UPI0030F4416D
MKSQELPHFICIGAQRAGTTWLHNCLDEHPEIYVPATKELHFFDRYYSEGLESYKAHFTTELRGDAKIWGEITPNYYQEPNALERIRQDIPNAKIIYILREPVSRAFSQYQLYAQSQFSGKTFEEIIAESEFVTDLSMQGKHLQRLLSLFSRENVLILLYDTLSAEPEKLLREVFRFLDVNEDFLPATISKRINRIVLPDLQNKLTKMKLSWIIELVKASPFSEFIKEIAHKKTDKTGTALDLKYYAETFKNDIDLIEKTLDIDLKHWR